MCYLASETLLSSSGAQLNKKEYAYDPNGSIIRLTETVGGTSKTNRYKYDAHGRLTREDNPHTDLSDPNLSRTVTYEYDANGDIKAKRYYQYTASESLPANALSVETFNFDEAPSTGYAYDPLGNPIKYKGQSLEWSGGKLNSYMTTGAGYNKFEYFYNEGGVRTQKNALGVTKKYYLDGAKVLGEKWTGSKNVDIEYYYDFQIYFRFYG